MPNNNGLGERLLKPLLPNESQQKQLNIEKQNQQVTSKIISDDPKEKRTKACTRCRKSKIKCQKLGDDQVCKRCKAHNLSCVYEYKIASYKIVSTDDTNISLSKHANTENPDNTTFNVDKWNTSANQRPTVAPPPPPPPLQPQPQTQPQPIQNIPSIPNNSGPSIMGLLNPMENTQSLATPSHTRPPNTYYHTKPVVRPSIQPKVQLGKSSHASSIPPESSATILNSNTAMPTSLTTVGKKWENSVENRLQDFDSKLGSILNLLQEQSQQKQRLPSINAQGSNPPQLPSLESRYYIPRPQITERQFSDQSISSKRSYEHEYSYASKRLKSSPEESEESSPLLQSGSSSPSPQNSLNLTENGMTIDQALTRQEAKELFQYFDSNISPQMFGFNISAYSVDEIWENCPLLVATVCAIASIHHPLLSHLFRNLDALIHSLSQQLLFKSPANDVEAFNTILALCFCGFWFQENQMFTGLALQLAKTMNLNRPITNKKSGISEKNRLKLWYLLYILDGQQSLVFNRQPLIDSNDKSLKNSRKLLLQKVPENKLEDIDKKENKPTNEVSIMPTISKAQAYSDLRLVSQVEYNQAISNVFNGDAWDLLTPASFGLPFKTNLELDKWMVQWTVLLSPFGKNPIWSSKSTLIYYNFAKMHINSAAVRKLHTDGTTLPSLDIAEVLREQNAVEEDIYFDGAEHELQDLDADDDDDDDDNEMETGNEMSPVQSRKVSTELSISAAETVLNVVLNDADILAALKYVPIHIHIMLYYAALLVLNPPSYLNTDKARSFDDSLASIKLVKKLRAIVMANVPIDRNFSGKLIDGITGMLKEKVLSLKQEIELGGGDSTVLVYKLDEAMNNDESYIIQTKKNQKIVAWPGFDHGHPSKS